MEQHLVGYRQFINWHEVPDPNPAKKPRKVPFNPRNGHSIDHLKPLNWMTYDEAVATGAPVGFVFTNADPYFFFDMDDCWNGTAWTDEATAIFNMFPGAAREISVNGKGLHVVGRCDQMVLSDRRNKFGTANRPNWLEFYTTERFMALGKGFVGDFNLDWTQQLLTLVPKRPAVDPVAMLSGPVPEYTGPQDDVELVRRMIASRGSIAAAFGTKASAKDLWEGDAANLSQVFPSPSGDVYDRSSADASLMAHLAFWTGKDAARMDRLFRMSKLFRPKYEKRADYRDNTIRNAISQTRKVYDVPPGVEKTIILPEHLNEDVLAEAFSKKYADELRYVSAWRCWLIWDGTRWKKENTLIVFNLVRAFCRASVQTVDVSPARAAKLVSSATINAVETLARADRRHASTADQWDADPWLLNTPDGVVDLKSGKMMPHDPNLHMRQRSAVGPSYSIDCPRFLQFLQEIFCGDDELISYVQRVFGYCLTGSVQEHAIFFGYGRGGNGKSVLINAITRLLGDYSMFHRWKRFPQATMNDIQPSWPDCRERALFPRKKLRKVVLGLKTD
jgi:primase-polymerase (primpol)-like protein